MSASLEEEKSCMNLNITDGEGQARRWEDEAWVVFFLSRGSDPFSKAVSRRAKQQASVFQTLPAVTL